MKTNLRLWPICGSLTLAIVIVAPMSIEAQTIGPEDRTAIIRELGDILRKEYVLPEYAPEMAARISSRLASGAYDDHAAAAQFADALTNDLRSVYPDKHLAILPPDRYKEFNRMVSGDHGHGGGEPRARPTIESRTMNRDGRTDVGYLKMPMFDGTAAGLAAMESTMRGLAGVEAMIIDLRSSPGGDADAVKALSSYFFSDATHLVSSIGPRDSTGQRPQFERWTTPNELSGQFANIPLYLLVNDETFSAAESFAFGMQRSSRATLVGVRTAGGGHMNAPFPLPAGFGASISVGRTFDPLTGEGWQATGVVPAIEVETDHALHAALTMIAEDASQNAGLDESAAGVHATLVEYADAWYLGNRERMARIVDPMLIESHIGGSSPATVRTAEDLLTSTEQGVGLQTPRELRNRAVTVLDVSTRSATAQLVLRETVHQMELELVQGKWRITADVVSAKPRHR